MKLIASDRLPELLPDLVRCHRICLPKTPGSRAPADVLASLYRTLINDSSAVVIWMQGDAPDTWCGGFAAGTVRLAATDRFVRSGLSWREILALACATARDPRPVLAKSRWNKLLPREGVGYILTIGVAPSSRQNGAPIRGASILNQLEGELAKRGAREVWVDTERSNHRAVAFYQRNAYQIVAHSFGQLLLRKVLGD
jgi:ribosomal protein S18 acetylase RimI-like enzyme